MTQATGPHTEHGAGLQLIASLIVLQHPARASMRCGHSEPRSSADRLGLEPRQTGHRGAKPVSPDAVLPPTTRPSGRRASAARISINDPEAASNRSAVGDAHRSADGCGHTEANLVPGRAQRWAASCSRGSSAKLLHRSRIQGRQPGQLGPISPPAIAGRARRFRAAAKRCCGPGSPNSRAQPSWGQTAISRRGAQSVRGSCRSIASMDGGLSDDRYAQRTV